MTMSTCKAKTQRITQAIDCDMDLCTESATAASQRLLKLTTVFFPPRQRTDAPERLLNQSSRFPCLGRQRNAPTSVPKHHGRTTEQSVCTQYSIDHTQQGADAIGHRSEFIQRTASTNRRQAASSLPTYACGSLCRKVKMRVQCSSSSYSCHDLIVRAFSNVNRT